MKTVQVKINTLEGAEVPQYKTSGSAGFDLVAHNFQKVYKGNKEVSMEVFKTIPNGYIFLRPQERALIGTGLMMEIPEGYELQIRPRSGQSLKTGLLVANSPGTIDSDYRGEIGIILYNSTAFPAKIELGQAIAQGVLTDYVPAEFVFDTVLTETTRGAGGFGHTDSLSPKPESNLKML